MSVYVNFTTCTFILATRPWLTMVRNHGQGPWSTMVEVDHGSKPWCHFTFMVSYGLPWSTMSVDTWLTMVDHGQTMVNHDPFHQGSGQSATCRLM